MYATVPLNDGGELPVGAVLQVRCARWLLAALYGLSPDFPIIAQKNPALVRLRERRIFFEQ